MTVNRLCLRAAFALVATVAWASLAGGCESVFGIGELPFPADGGGDVNEPDSTADTGNADARPDADSGPVDAPEAGPPPCTPTLAYTPVPWAPPTAFPQAACTSIQVSAYLSCFPNCDTFRQDLANAACVTCIETDETAVAHGAVITTRVNGQVRPLQINAGGCQAHFDMSAGAMSCGEQENDLRGCLSTECGTCSDFANPTASGPTAMCEQAALGGPCSGDAVASTCDQELDGGVAAPCDSLQTFLPLWCQPPGMGPTCYMPTTFTPDPWQPPTDFAPPGSGPCNPMEIAAYIGCFPNCESFATDGGGSPGCLACIETDVSATQHGPVITQGGAVLEVNFGGCQAHLDGHTTSADCGNRLNEFNSCAAQECGTCADFANQVAGGPTAQCIESAFNGGICTPYNETTACDTELVDGGVASACFDLASFLPMWCQGQ